LASRIEGATRQLDPFASPDGEKTQSFGTGRVCSVEGCETRLSTYNPSNICSLHNHGWRLAMPSPNRFRSNREPVSHVCAYSGCTNTFLSNDTRKKYCSDTCRFNAFNKGENDRKDPLTRYYAPTTLTVLTLFLENSETSHYPCEIARTTEISITTVQRILRRLEAEGWFTSIVEVSSSAHPKRFFTMTKTGVELARKVLAENTL